MDAEDDLISPPLVVSLFTFVRGVGSLTSGEWEWIFQR